MTFRVFKRTESCRTGVLGILSVSLNYISSEISLVCRKNAKQTGCFCLTGQKQDVTINK